jgi:hypothetical protein
MLMKVTDNLYFTNERLDGTELTLNTVKNTCSLKNLETHATLSTSS